MTACNPSIQPASAWQRIVQSIAEAARRTNEAAARARRQRKLMSEFEELDDRMLRDIGVHRTEIGSVVAEVVGVAPASRRRLMRSAAGRVA